jgi:hypothetical protein
VKHHFCLDPFIQRGVEVEQTAGERKLVQAGPYLSSAFQPDHGQNGSGQFDSRGAPLVVCLLGMGHTSFLLCHCLPRRGRLRKRAAFLREKTFALHSLWQETIPQSSFSTRNSHFR